MTNEINTTETNHWESSSEPAVDGSHAGGTVLDDTMQALHNLLMSLEASCLLESESDPSPSSTGIVNIFTMFKYLRIVLVSDVILLINKIEARCVVETFTMFHTLN